MNCTIIQRRLLATERPEQPPPEIKEHLAQCPACRAWQRRLVQLERLLPQLSVPPSMAKELFLEKVKAEGGRQRQDAVVYPSVFLFPSIKKERALRKLSLAFTLAASLLLFALAWWSWPHNPGAPPLPLRNDQARLEERLSKSLHADVPKERVRRLAELAEEVRGEARKWMGNSKRLEQWSQFYARVVGQHLIEQARQLSPEDRQAVLGKIALRLAEAESEATRLAAQCQAAALRSATAWQRIAFISQKGERDLRALLKG